MIRIPHFLVVSLILFTFFSCNKEEEKAGEVAIGEIKRGTLYLELYEEGEIEAINSTNIL